VTFLLDGETYRAVYNDLGEIGGCCLLNGKDFQECGDCRYEKVCPAWCEVEE
jgi:hypothetical protein